MSLAAGVRIGPYEIQSALGAGGMGEVYRATDTRLKRDVAIKVLPAALASDPDRLARFQREAELLATLNHPNIAAIYGLEDSGGSIAIVLELVDGETLAEHLARGPLALDEALRVARQIVDALEAAHDRGVVHRDLKPANIKVTPGGQVKVLDFGLAKMLESEAPASTLSMSPTLSMHATYAGVILGTAAYMSPEQARGKAVDRRTDVWAFGCVLFEMLAGTQVFENSGDTLSDAVAAVLMKEPNWSALPASTPPHIRTLLRRCLQKDVQKRVPHIGVARIEIDDPPAADARPAAAVTEAARPRPLWRRTIPVAAGVVLAAALTSVAWWRLRPGAPTAAVTRFALMLPDGQTFSNAGRQVVALSPDGTQMVYVANQRLYVRALSDLEPRPIAGIDGANTVTSPVFSPDGRSIAYFSGADGTLKRIAVTGGAPITICSAANPIGMSWGVEGVLFSQGGKGVMRVSPNGGAPEVIVSVNSDQVAHGPQMLPGGNAVLFSLLSNTTDSWDKAQVVVQSLASGDRKVVIEGGGDARYLPTGHLVYAVSGVILAIPFDARRFQVSGGPVPVVEGVRRAPAPATGTAQFAVSATGTLAYVPGPVSASATLRELALIDRQGTATRLKLQPANFEHPRVSPDGTRIVFVVDDDKETDVWSYELSGATARRRLTFGGRNRFPIWSPDGLRVAFQSDRDGDRGVFSQRADGAGAAERLTRADKDTAHVPESWSPRGDGILFRVVKTTNSLAFYGFKDQQITPFGGVESLTPTNAMFSPDGRWVAYEASAGKANDRVIYVQPFPATGSKYQVPRLDQAEYRHPRWSPDGRELFYVLGGNVRLSVTTQPAFAFGNAAVIPRPGFWLDSFRDTARSYDVMPDGRHFLARVSAGAAPGEGAAEQIRVVLNWFEELRQRVPPT